MRKSGETNAAVTTRSADNTASVNHRYCFWYRRTKAFDILLLLHLTVAMATPRARRGIRRIPKLHNEGFLNPTVELSISRSSSITDSHCGVFLKRRRGKKRSQRRWKEHNGARCKEPSRRSGGKRKRLPGFRLPAGKNTTSVDMKAHIVTLHTSQSNSSPGHQAARAASLGPFCIQI